MTITFDPTGEVVVGVGDTVSYQTTVGLGAQTLPTYTVPSGYTAVETTYTSGNPAAVISDGGYFVRFFAGDSKTLLVTKFEMDDETALETARTTIEGALAAGDTALTLKSDGTAGS